MPTSHQYIFVLWGAQCEEAPAAIFVSELRAAGLRVKVVGLDGIHANGTHGLALLPDITLSQALPLARLASCIILPCAPATLQRMAGDPRLQEFVMLAQAEQALFVVEGAVHPQLPEIGLEVANLGEDVLIYPLGAALFDFTHEIIHALSG
ncbi:MAG: hypothetical protein KDE46_17065 [Caldilineaceae bacterium]|nr:hypothetical protein [Caldilineaceae bacterium]